MMRIVRSMVACCILSCVGSGAGQETSTSADPILSTRYRTMLQQDAEAALGLPLIQASLSEDPVVLASLKQVLLETLVSSHTRDIRRDAFRLVAKIQERGKLPDDGSFKTFVVDFVRSEIAEEESFTYEVLESVALIDLTPEEYDEMLSRTLTIDKVPVWGPGMRLREGSVRRHSYGSTLLAALAIKGGPDAYPRIQAVIAEGKRTRPGLRLYSDYMGPRILLGTGSPDAYRDMLRQCIESVEIGRPRKELRFLAGSLISKHAQYTPKEREQIIALCRAAATNEGGIFPDHVRIGVIGSLTEVLEKGGPSVEPEVAAVLDDSRAFWSVPGRMPHTFKIDETLQKYRARRAAAGLGS